MQTIILLFSTIIKGDLFVFSIIITALGKKLGSFK